jgi:hypothetical protein
MPGTIIPGTPTTKAGTFLYVAGLTKVSTRPGPDRAVFLARLRSVERLYYSKGLFCVKVQLCWQEMLLAHLSNVYMSF